MALLKLIFQYIVLLIWFVISNIPSLLIIGGIVLIVRYIIKRKKKKAAATSDPQDPQPPT